MTTLLASLIGFISSIIPEIIKYFKDISDKKHEHALLTQHIKCTNKEKLREIEDMRIVRDILEQESLYTTYYCKNKWINALNASVRPLIAYCFFSLYVYVKYVQYMAVTKSDNLLDYLNILWTLDDQAIFAGIISFYFGQRTFRRIWLDRT